MRRAPEIELTEKQRKQLQRLAHGTRRNPQRIVDRANIVLLAAQGMENKDIASKLGQDRGKVGRWRKRFARLGMDGIIKDKTRPGRIPAISAEIRSAIIDKTLTGEPEGATHWSRTSMSKATGVSPSTVGRIWKANGIKPHLASTFKLSNDKNFEEKLEDIVGLYLSPPENAIVLSCDEKSSIQALDRTQPGLPLKKGRGKTMTHDYKRNGTTSLFAALNTADGSIISTCQKRHRHQEWLSFLKLIERETDSEKEIHIICDNFATHKHEKVKAWQKRNKRFHFHFTPTSASWLNMVERFFRNITDKSLRRGVFHSVEALVEAIEKHIEVHNRDPKPFIWTATAKDILAKVKRGRATLDKMQTA